LIKLTWGEVDWQSRCWVIHKHKATRTARVSRPRVVPMPPIVVRLLAWERAHNGQGQRVFLNGQGRPWTINALRCRMRRLRQKSRDRARS
jgi:integrase